MAIGFVRPARPDDASGIARIQLSTWRTAYRRLLPRHVLDELNEDWMAGHWARAIGEPPSDRHRVLVAVEQAEQQHLVGFLASGPADEEALSPEEALSAEEAAADPALPAFAPEVVAVTDLLVEPRWGRRGHGSRLLAAGVEHWYSDGFDTALAWAYQDDAATLKFLASAGWAPDGAARALDVDDRLIPQVRLHVSISEPAPPGAGSAEQLADADGEPGPADH
jgi:GNAT superfamily N-acetyltransferase